MLREKTSLSCSRHKSCISIISAHGKENLKPTKNFQKQKQVGQKNLKPCQKTNRKDFFGEKSIEQCRNRKTIDCLTRESYEMKIPDDFFDKIECRILESEPSFKGLFGGNNTICEKIRGTMIEWMLDIFWNFENTTDFTFFKAVTILNMYFKKSVRKIYDEDLHLSGIVSIFLASKFEDVLHLPLKSIVTWLGHNKFTREEIKEREYEILYCLNFDLAIPTALNYRNILLYKAFKNYKSPYLDMISQYSLLILKISQFWTHTVETNPCLLGFSSVIYAIKKASNVIKGNLKRDNISFFEEIEERILRNVCMNINKYSLKELSDCLQLLKTLERSWKIIYPRFNNIFKY